MRATHLRRHLVSALTFAFLIFTATVRVVQAAPIPSPWVAPDIGAPAVSGSSSYDSTQKAFTVSAAGSDVSGTSDQFRFVYQQVTGDVDIVARVDSLLQTDQWSKAGVMIRSSLAAGAAHGFALVSAKKGTAFQWRAQVNGQSANASGGTGAAPRWVRLVRTGTSLTAYTATDGATWKSMVSATIALGATAYVGLAVTSHHASASTTAVISQTSVATPTSSLPTPQKDADIGDPLGRVGHVPTGHLHDRGRRQRYLGSGRSIQLRLSTGEGRHRRVRTGRVASGHEQLGESRRDDSRDSRQGLTRGHGVVVQGKRHHISAPH